MPLGDVHGVADNDSLPMDWGHGAQCNVLDSQFLTPSCKELSLMDSSFFVAAFNVAFVDVFKSEALRADMRSGGTR